MSSKRRASSDMTTPAPKKRRQNEDNHWPAGQETAEGTTATGLKLLDMLKKSQDKTGRQVALEFFQLPSRSNAAYYRRIKLPLSFREIEAKLDARKYANLTELERDLKRMIQNAKEYNVTGSNIYEDAERVRKALSNCMPKYNPAYKDKDYRAVPTPVPGENGQDAADNTNATSREPAPPSTTTKSRINGSTLRRSRSKAMDKTANMTEVNIQEEQQKIVQEMIELRDPDDAETEITLEFYEKPSRRDYPDYYRQIAHPTALKDIQKAVSKDKYSTWESFVTEVEFLWENARTYNEEGSFIHENANKLRDWFLSRMSGIEGAGEIAAPKKLKLNPPKNPPQQPTPRIKLSNPNKDMAQAGIAVDEEARRRQNEHVKAASRGQIVKSPKKPSQQAVRPAASMEAPQASPPPPAMSADIQQPEVSAAPADSVDKGKDSAGDQTTAEAPTKDENGHPPTGDEVSTRRSPSTGPMQPPAPVSQQTHPARATQSPVPRPAYQASSAFDRIFRDPGKGPDDALYQGIRASTWPDLQHPDPWTMQFRPAATQTQYGLIVTLPPSHYCLRITAWLSKESLSREQCRIVVSNDLEIIDSVRTTNNGGIVHKVDLHRGVNTICIDFMATINKKGQPAPIWPEERHDFERFVLTVHYVSHL